MRVLLVSPGEAHHEGIAVALAARGMQVSRCPFDPASAARAVAEHDPDVVLVGATADRRHSAEVVRAACQGVAPGPATRPVVLLAARDTGPGARWAFEAGAVAYLLPSVPLDDVLRVVDAVAASPPDPRVVREWMANSGGHASAPPLSERQRQVLDYVGRGLSDREIARLLSVSTSTVHREISTLLRVFGVSNRTQLAARAGHQGLR